MKPIRTEELVDVVAVSLKDHTIEWVEENKTRQNAEAIIAISVMRQGTKHHFFKAVKHGRFKKGDSLYKKHNPPRKIKAVVKTTPYIPTKPPRFKGKIWWHWLIEYCPECKQGVSQGPMAEDLGCDCDLFEKIKEYNEKQEEGETKYKCYCGTALVMKYRHATADMTKAEIKRATAYMLDQVSA